MEVVLRPTAKLLKEEQKHVPVIHMCIYSAWFWLIVFPVPGVARLVYARFRNDTASGITRQRHY